MSHPLPNFKEEQSAKIPALTLLTNLKYTFVPPAKCNEVRGNLSTVIHPRANASDEYQFKSSKRETV